MTHVIITVKPGQTLEQGECTEHRKSPSLSTLQEAVGGFIETVPHLTSLELDGRRVRCLAYVNEEGRILDMPLNHEMSALWVSELLRQDPRGNFRYKPELFGPVAFVIKCQPAEAKT